MSSDPQFPCSMQVKSNFLTLLPQLRIPFPTPRLASTALKALQVDPELSPLVRRRLSVASPSPAGSAGEAQILQVQYQATTNRMLRVAVNSFMEGLKLVLEVMERLDVDVLAAESKTLIKSP
ncbi:hypothetical protein Trco_000546 [Trichoderma cornu-damae]|uniref:Transcription factor Pcc1 n=1 Tax=Trichoderma cornu-damae TaxID=654480 RepID=A0A9P8QQH5_9HYPO|nr:hypothetical protein Trco_000546 [Trichoderma cornu-damae]